MSKKNKIPTTREEVRKIVKELNYVNLREVMYAYDYKHAATLLDARVVTDDYSNLSEPEVFLIRSRMKEALESHSSDPEAARDAYLKSRVGMGSIILNARLDKPSRRGTAIVEILECGGVDLLCEVRGFTEYVNDSTFTNGSWTSIPSLSGYPLNRAHRREKRALDNNPNEWQALVTPRHPKPATFPSKEDTCHTTVPDEFFVTTTAATDDLQDTVDSLIDRSKYLPDEIFMHIDALLHDAHVDRISSGRVLVCFANHRIVALSDYQENK